MIRIVPPRAPIMRDAHEIGDLRGPGDARDNLRAAPAITTAVIRTIGAAALLVGVLAVTSPAQQKNAALPTPESVIGFPVGTDYKLFTYDQSIDYFKRLAAAASSRVKLITVGKTSFGKTWTAVIISSPANLARLDALKEINQKLAHPANLTDAQARQLAKDGRAFVDISGGLHASEIAGSQHTPLVAYELLSRANEPEMKAILDSTVFFLWPSINPDGQDIVVNWCRSRDVGPGQTNQVPPMELYQKYVGHDNNRDSYMLNMIESRAVQRTWREWEPQIIYVQHQSSPFPTRIWLPPFADPVGLRVPPIMARQVNAIGTRIATELDEQGKPGAVSQLETYDAWYPGYIDYMPMYQNINAWWTETQGGNCAVPRTSTIADLPRDYKDLRPTSLYTSPWAEGTWTLRNAIDYMVTADIATLRYATKFKNELLYNRYQSAKNTIKQFSTSAPYAYIVPQAQHDPNAPVELLRRMAFMGVHVEQLDRDMAYGGTTYPKGTWVIPMDQEYAQLVRELFEQQHYPDLGEDTPYDAAGWTLPYQMDVNVVEGKTPLSADFRAALTTPKGKAVDWHTDPSEPFTTNAYAAGIVAPTGAITGSGDQLLLDPAQNNSFRLMNRALAEGAKVSFVPASNGRGARYDVTGLDAAKANAWAKDLAVTAERVSGAPAGAASAPTRVALYKSQPGVMDEGWTEWLFDTYGFKYTLITPDDVRGGNLGARFDVIVLASQGIGAGGRGGRGGGGGGGGGRGRGNAAADSAAALIVNALDEFVKGGGSLVAWNQGAAAAVNALHLPVQNVVAGLRDTAFFTGGSIMQVTTDPTQPVMAGMPERADVFVSNSPVFATLDGFQGSVLAKFATDSATLLRSGFLRGPKYMTGFAAALDVKHDRGHVVLLAFQPEWRGQPQGTFRTVFNSAFFSRGVADQATPNAGFWTSPPLPAPAAGRGGPPGHDPH